MPLLYWIMVEVNETKVWSLVKTNPQGVVRLILLCCVLNCHIKEVCMEAVLDGVHPLPTYKYGVGVGVGDSVWRALLIVMDLRRASQKHLMTFKHWPLQCSVEFDMRITVHSCQERRHRWVLISAASSDFQIFNCTTNSTKFLPMMIFELLDFYCGTKEERAFALVLIFQEAEVGSN